MKSKKRNFVFVLFLLFFVLTWFSCDPDDAPIVCDPPAVECPSPLFPPDSVFIISYSLPDNAADTLDIGWTLVSGATGYHLVVLDFMDEILLDTMINDGTTTNFLFITDVELSEKVPLLIKVSSKCQENESDSQSISADFLICDDEVGIVNNIHDCSLNCVYIQPHSSYALSSYIVYDRLDFCNCLNITANSKIINCANNTTMIYVGRAVNPTCQ